MKKIIIHNGTNRTLSIITDETIFVVKSNEKIAIETVSKLICVKNKNDTRARIMVGLQYEAAPKILCKSNLHNKQIIG